MTAGSEDKPVVSHAPAETPDLVPTTAAPPSKRQKTNEEFSLYPPYVYNAKAPLDISQIERASNTLLEVNTSFDFDIRQRVKSDLIEFVEALSRVRPFLPENEQGPVDTLLEIWLDTQSRAGLSSEEKRAKINERVTGYAQADLSLKEEKRQKAAKQQKEWEAQQEKERIEKVKKEIEQDNEVDEDELPYSAWSLRESPYERLIAASRYINNMQYRNTKLEEDPMLIALRPEAMQMLADGGLRGVAASETFLKAYDQQAELEKENKDAKSKDEVDDLIDSLDDFDLSEGEEKEADSDVDSEDGRDAEKEGKSS